MIYFGDSLTAAESAQVDPGRVYYPWLVSMLRGDPPPTVLAKAGHCAADQAAAVYATTPNARSLLLIGTNDRLAYRVSGVTDPNGVALFKNEISAMAYWLAGQKVTAQQAGWSFTGTWANYVSTHPWASVGRYTPAGTGATANATFSGDLLLVGYTMADGLAGSLTVKVDGVTVGSINTAAPRTISIGSGHSIYAPGVFRASGFGPGTHTLSLVASTSSYIMVDWIGAGPSSTPLSLLTLPYTANGDNAEVDTFNAVHTQVAAQCMADGYQVDVIATGSVIRLNEMCANSATTNNYHPDNNGDLNMATAILAALR